MEITLPQYSWFEITFNKKSGKSSPFTGSCGTDPILGFMHRKELHYTVQSLRLEDETLIFNVDSYIEMPFLPGKGREKTAHESKQFQNSEQGYTQIKEYLETRAKERA